MPSEFSFSIPSSATLNKELVCFLCLFSSICTFVHNSWRFIQKLLKWMTQYPEKQSEYLGGLIEAIVGPRISNWIIWGF